jgi:hypothetical protein
MKQSSVPDPTESQKRTRTTRTPRFISTSDRHAPVLFASQFIWLCPSNDHHFVVPPELLARVHHLAMSNADWHFFMVSSEPVYFRSLEKLHCVWHFDSRELRYDTLPSLGISSIRRSRRAVETKMSIQSWTSTCYQCGKSK